MRVQPGRHHPLGATWDGMGTNFALMASQATGVELCLYDAPTGGNETHRLRLTERSGDVWHAYLPDVRPGQCYGYRVHGPYDPGAGLRYNPAKLLLDPYAKAIGGTIEWRDELFGYPEGQPDAPTPDARDSAPAVPKSVVVDTAYPWGDDRPPRTPWHRTVIYECHVKGMTMRHPHVPEALRGTYLGLSTEPVLEHLLALGVTAVQLLPVQHFVTQRFVARLGLTNYWGYNTIGFFAPDVRYATGALGQQVDEFRTMVKRMHRAGLEVILDVVYNHTAEGSDRGPTLCFRGVDNLRWYRHDDGDRRRYVDWTGCGNTVDLRSAPVRRLVMDSLRYWVENMHVDGFRFDLAPVLARGDHAFDPHARLFEMIRQDPVLAPVKLIAEPWDAGPDGYHLGAFPPGWSEWNDRFRNDARRFWRGDGGVLPAFVSGLAGSSGLFAGRGPKASINHVTCHDGFTLRDVVSYDRKHNEANGEDNRDGPDENFSRNWGVEGPTANAGVLHLRERVTRSLLATVAFAQGVPMLLHGDEIGRSQQGNNNAWCQDNEASWMSWELTDAQRELLHFTRRLFAIRREFPVLRRRTFFSGRPVGDGLRDVNWYLPDGRAAGDGDWANPRLHAIAMLVPAESSEERDDTGRPAPAKPVLLIVNGGGRTVRFVLPQRSGIRVWIELVNTTRPGPRMPVDEAVNVAPRSLILLTGNGAA